MVKFSVFSAFAAGISLTCLAATPVRANDAPPLTEDEAFAAVFENPGDLILNFQLVISQLREQNIKGAVATLERILTLSHNNSQAQALLAGAQFRLGNLAEARRMAEILLLNPAATETQKTEISELLSLIDNAEKSYNITGVVTVGGGVADNPEGGSIGNRSITGFEYSKRANAHSFLTSSVALNITSNLVSQLPESLSFGVTASARDMEDYSLGDITSLGLNGRYLKTFADRQLTFLGTYLNTSIDDRTYLDTFSLQVTDTFIPAPDWALATSARISQHSFHDSFDTSLANKPSEKNGTSISLSGRIVHAAGLYQMAMTLNGAEDDRRQEYHAKKSRGIGVELSRQFFGGIASIGLDHEMAEYKAANPAFQLRQRKDEISTVTAGFAIGLKSFLPGLDQPPRLRFSVNYGKTSSNIAEFSKYSGEALVLLVQPI